MKIYSDFRGGVFEIVPTNMADPISAACQQKPYTESCNEILSSKPCVLNTEIGEEENTITPQTFTINLNGENQEIDLQKSFMKYRKSRQVREKFLFKLPLDLCKIRKIILQNVMHSEFFSFDILVRCVYIPYGIYKNIYNISYNQFLSQNKYNMKLESFFVTVSDAVMKGGGGCVEPHCKLQ